MSAILRFFDVVEGKHWPLIADFIPSGFCVCADDATRIILQGNEDYINANYVNVSQRPVLAPFLYYNSRLNLAFLRNKGVLFNIWGISKCKLRKNL